MIKYLIIAIGLVAVLFFLLMLSEKFMDKYGKNIIKNRGISEKKTFFVDYNNTCMIIAFLLLVISFLPDLNSILFVVMSILFALRSLKGPMSVFGAIWLFIGSFFLGVAVSYERAGMMETPVIAFLLLIAIPFLFLGFRRKKVKRKKNHVRT